MLNKKVIHKTFGEGVIIRFENNIVTAEFSGKTMNFRYPDIFSKFLRFVDDEAQNEVKALADEAVAKKEAEDRAKAIAKAEEIRRHYARMIAEENKKRKISAAELKNKEHGNLAFKANFCDGGCSESCIGFKGVCSPEQIKYNIEQERRAWCSNAASPCGRYYKGEITYDELIAIHKESFVCYESRMLTEWRADAGENLNDNGVHKARRITNAKQNGLAVLTTVIPGTTERVIFGVFISGVIDDGDDLSAGYVKADPEYTIELTPDEAKQLKFWDYYKNAGNPDSTQWGTGLYRYLSNDICIKILSKIVEIKSGEEKAYAEKVLSRYVALKGITIRYKFDTQSGSVNSKIYYNLAEAKADSEKACADAKEDVMLWEMPNNQFKPDAFVFVHWQLYGKYIYNSNNISFEKQ